MKPAHLVLLAFACSLGGAVAIGCSSQDAPADLNIIPVAGETPTSDLGQTDLGEGDTDPSIDGDDAIGDDPSASVNPTSSDDGGVSTTDDGGSTTDDGGADAGDDSGDDGSMDDDDDGGDPDATDPDDTDPYPDGNPIAVTITSGAKKPHNVGFGGRWRANKVGGWVLATNTCDATPMYYGAAESSALVKNARGQDVHLAKSRPVVVQMAPGLRNGFVWVEPDLGSITDARAKVTFGAATKAMTPYIGARGWVRSDCLKPGKTKGKFPTKHVLNPAGDSVPVIGTVTPMMLKQNDKGTAVACDVRAHYTHSSGAGYANYANRNAYSKGVYLTFNTPSATYKGVVSGGGVTGGYVTLTDTFNMVAKVDDKAVQKDHTKNPHGTLAVSFRKVNGAADKGADDQHPGEWAYGYVDQDGQRAWGYVYYDCLTAGQSDETAPSQPQSDSCTGKSDGEYCSVLQDQSFICQGGLISGGNSCPAGQMCTPDANGIKIDCE